MKGKVKRLAAGFLSLVMLVSSNGIVMAADNKADSVEAGESVNFGAEDESLYTGEEAGWGMEPSGEEAEEFGQSSSEEAVTFGGESPAGSNEAADGESLPEAETTSAGQAPAARAEAHNHTGERLYVTDLYQNERAGSNIGYIVAHFWKTEPQWNEKDGVYVAGTGEGGDGLEQYMTSEEEHYVVRIPEVKGENNAFYQWVTFEMHYEDNEPMRFRKKFHFYGEQENYSAERVEFDFEASEKDTIYVGMNSQCYVSSHPISESDTLTNETIFFDFNDIPASLGGKAEPFIDENTQQEYYKLEWKDEDGKQRNGRIETKARTSGVWYYTFTGKDNAVEGTIFTLRAKNSSPSGIKFIYSRTVEEENMFCVGGTLSHQKVWKTYQAAPWEGDITITINAALTGVENPDDIHIQYSTQDNEPIGNIGWADASLLEPDLKYPNIYGADTIPNEAKWVRIGMYKNGVKWSSAYSITNPELLRWDYPCFYMLNTDNGKLSGEWGSVFVGHSAGDDAQLIEEGTYVRDEDSYYATADFYDYYSTFEMTGHALVKRQEDGSYITASGDFNTAGSVFNSALQYLYVNSGMDPLSKYDTLYLSGSDGTLTNSGLTNGDMSANDWKPSNLWDQDDMVTLGLVDDTLNEKGQLTMGKGAILNPFFDKDFLRGENFFNMAIGQVYDNVVFPFKKNVEGYWEFNSANQKDAVALKKDTNEGYYLERRKPGEEIKNANNKNGRTYGFFPYDTYVENWTNVDDDGNTRCNKRNEYFGVNMNIPFSITDTGTIKTKQPDGSYDDQDIIFEFSGDDDVWFFIDGKLVLDLGGIHGTCGGTINFNTGEVTYEQSYRLYNRDGHEDGAYAQQIGNLKNINGEDLLSSLKDGKTHTFTMYYMERGQWDSNMHIRFNFPRKSTLTVTNTIHTDGANSIFKNALDNLGGLSFKMYNQAVSGDPLPVEQADGYVPGDRTGDIVTPNETTPEKPEEGDVTEIKWEESAEEGETERGQILSYTVENSIAGWTEKEAVDKRMAKIPVEYDSRQFPLNDLAYLYMDVWSGEASVDGRRMYVRINGKSRWGIGEEKVLCEGSLNNLKYSGNNNIIQPGKWNTVRVSLENISSSDKRSYYISSIEIGFRTANTLKLDKLSLCEPLQKNEMEGFAVEEDRISDYGSLEAEGFQPPEGADYRVYAGLDTEANIENGSLRRIGGQGYFTLGDQEKAVFFDKFRAGSYIHLHEAVIDGQGKIFRTQYSMNEGNDEKGYAPITKDYLIPNRDGVTSVNSTIIGVPYDLKSISGRTVEDHRESIRTIEENGRIRYETVDRNFTPVNHMLIDGEEPRAFVYRNYKEPDILAGSGIDLRVDYVNELRFGEITIKKKLVYDEILNEGVSQEEFYKMMDGRSFKFRVYFTNIADRALETYTDEEVYEDVTLQVHKVTDEEGNIIGLEGTATIKGIPAGTEYAIYEIADVGTKLSKIEVGECKILSGGNAHTDIGDVYSDTESEKQTQPKVMKFDQQDDEWNGAYARGKVFESNQEFVFTNKVEKDGTLTVRKTWSNVTEEELNNNYEATIRLLVRVIGTDKWEQAKHSDGQNVADVTLSGNEEHKYDKIPAYVLKKDENDNPVFQALEYRVEEVGSTQDGFVPIYGVDKEGVQHIVNIKEGQTFYVWEEHKTELPVGLNGVNEPNLDLTNYDIMFRYEGTNELVSENILNVNTKGKVEITSPEVGLKNYIMTVTPKTEEEEEKSVRITVYTYDVDRDIYVLDYGLPVELAKANESVEHGIFTNDSYSAVTNDSVNVSFKGFTDTPDSQTAQYKLEDFVSTAEKVRNGTLSVKLKEDGAQPSDSVKPSDVTIKFTPTRIMDRVDVYKYKTVVTAADYEGTEADITPKSGVVMTEEVKIMPASVVYYEDNFNPNLTDEDNNNGKNGIRYEGNYPVSIVEETIPEEVLQSIDPNEAYGHDDVYEDAQGSEPGKTDSLGSSTRLESTDTVTTKAKFEFTGTGFDIVGRTDNRSPLLVYDIYANERVALNGKVYQAGELIRFGIVDAFYEGNEADGLRQLPVISVQNLPRASYKVVISAVPGKTAEGDALRFMMDGIRIYNPLSKEDTVDYSTAERNAAVTGIRKLILGDTTLNDQGTLEPGTVLSGAKAALVYSDGYSAENTFELGSTATEVSGVTESAVSTSQLNDFLVTGPKNELYLPKGSAVAFYVQDRGGLKTEKILQVEAKAVNTNSIHFIKDDDVSGEKQTKYPVLLNVKTNAETREEIPIDSSTAMYYKLSLEGCKSVGQNKYLMILANDSDTDISLTNIKTKGYELSYPTGGINKLESTEVDEAALKKIQNLYDQEVDVTTPKHPVAITDAAFTAPYAKQGGSVYLNVTMKMNTPAYHPVIYQYKDGGEEPDSLERLEYRTEDGTDGVIEADTALKPLWKYTKTETESNAEGKTVEVKNQYFVFKVKMTLDDTKYLADTKYTFAVGAEENSTDGTNTEKVVKVNVQADSIWVRAANWAPKVEQEGKPTNQAVTVTLHAGEEILPVEGWTKVDKETYTKEYEENGDYSVRVENKGGYRKTLAFSVKNIDKTAPEVKVKVDYTKEDKAIVTLTANEELQELKGWTEAEKFVYTKTYTKNGEYSVTVKDLAGNETAVAYEVTGLVESEDPKEEETEKPGEDSKEEETDKPGEDSKDDEVDKPEKEVFSDVRKGDWYYEEVMDVYALKYMTGLEKDFFGAEHTLVRAQFATILYRMAGEPKVDFKDRFADVKDGHFYSDAVTWAYENDIITGYEDTGLFGPNDAITREQMAAVMYRYAKTTGKEMKKGGSLAAFSDSDKVQKFAKKAITWCVEEGIISGDKGRLNPQGSAIRAEAAAIISRFDKNLR